MILHRLSPEQATVAWPLMEPWLKQLADRFPDDWPIETVIEGIQEEHLASFIIWEEKERQCYGLVLTAIMTKASNRKALRIHAVGKDHKSWVSLILDLEEYGRKTGCDLIEVVGRSGWERSLKDYDKERVALLSKELR
jgi:hypothetical protein